MSERVKPVYEAACRHTVNAEIEDREFAALDELYEAARANGRKVEAPSPFNGTAPK